SSEILVIYLFATRRSSDLSFMDSEDIVYGYCTEYFVEFTEDKLKKHAFVEDDFRQTLSNYGDSLLVASTDEFVKVHVHTEAPGEDRKSTRLNSSHVSISYA